MSPDVTMAFDGHLEQLERDWADCKTIDTRRNMTVDALFRAMAKVTRENNRLRDDMEMSELSNRGLLDIKRKLELQNAQLQNRLSPSPFVLILIDGDATQFNDSFVKAGTDGGHGAAHGLKEAVENYITSKLHLPASTKIVARVYFNALGLKSAYVNAGIIGEGRILWDFVLGFNRELQLAEFVDAGQDKEAADHKIKGNLDLYWRDENCRHILLACSADQGYVSHLRQYSNKTEDRERLTLIESKPFPAAFRDLAAAFGEVQRFDELFRTSHLVAQTSRVVPVRAAASAWTITTTQDTPPTSQQVSPAVQAVATPIVAARPTRLIPLNKKGQRIHRPLLHYQGEMLADMQERNLCPQFHLTHCPLTVRACEYNHTPVNLSIEEKRLLARVARTMVCPRGFTCRDRDCVRGHHCLYDETCHYKATCKFGPAQHHVDKEIVKEV